MTMPEVIAFIEGYADAIGAPVHTDTTVTALRRVRRRLRRRDRPGRVASARRRARVGALQRRRTSPRSPRWSPLASRRSRRRSTATPASWTRVACSLSARPATGIQLADEIQRSGRQVTVAVGEHVRAPRVYRGMDIQWWMDVTGLIDERYDEVDDIVRVRRLPSFQLAGTPDRRTIDLNALTDIGVQLVGKFAGVSEEGKAQFSGSLRNQCALADLKLGRLLDTIDEWATRERARSRDRSSASFRADRASRTIRRLMLDLTKRPVPDDHLGDRVSSRLLLARRPGPRREGLHPSRRRGRRRFAGDVPDGHAVPAPAQVDASSTAPPTTRTTSATTSPPTSTAGARTPSRTRADNPPYLAGYSRENAGGG